MTDRDVDVLSKAPLFEALDDQGAKALRANVNEVRLARGQTLFNEGETGDRLYVVLDADDPDAASELCTVELRGEW